MNEVGEKFLPIGTVVMLKEGTKRVMITGFCSAAQDDPQTIWDYTGCPYPEGYVTSDQTCLFNHSQISKIYFTGFKDDDEEKQFKDALNKLFTALKANSQVAPAPVNNEQSTEVLES